MVLGLVFILKDSLMAEDPWECYSFSIEEQSRLHKEDNDCTVIAWSNCFDACYKDSLVWMRKHGRLPRRGMKRKQIEAALKACRRSKIKFGPYTRDNRISVSQFIKKHPVGRYYVLVSRHALCIKDGIIHDYKYGPRRQITFAARVYLEGEI